ncbi:hypothetical protein CYLTODRAFT_416706 [Cylindrobasidium torrendii FP15055 ss-10]|uniref:DUF7719 domain-containing protein n=1 Tax=Cylindrobasidium torrendii FP15055 ss-10 TaxID=1314674 RepID=A0A0D7BTX8_9AGAR|nr:hypothetical protein CYLTODRAFT_416706 [Cylindrobasidium torrendii FP15055 ss-10]
MQKRHTASTKASEPSIQDMEIPEEEQWRLINESGILSEVPLARPEGGHRVEEKEDVPEEEVFAEEVFDAVLYIVPFSFCLLLMEILVHRQYGREASVSDLMDRMIPGVPILSIFIFYTKRYKNHRKMQFALFIMGSLAACRMMNLLALSGFKKIMKQAPPLATLWIYTIVQLELGPAVLNLAVVAIYVLAAGLKVTE